MSVGGGPDIVQDGLVLYLDAGNRKSYPGSGTTWSDLTINRNNGTLTNGPTFDSNNNGVFSFDGVDDHVTVADITGVTDFSNTDNYTIDFWVYLNSTQNNTVNPDNSVLEKWSSSGGYPYVFRYNRSISTISLGVYNSSTVQGVGVSVTTNRWINICGVLSWPNSLATLYRDGGQEVGTLAITLTGTITNTSELFLMRRGGGTTNYCTGRMASLKIYNRALSAKDVLQNFNATRSRFGV